MANFSLCVFQDGAANVIPEHRLMNLFRTNLSIVIVRKILTGFNCN